jgi:hypothetical protein
MDINVFGNSQMRFKTKNKEYRIHGNFSLHNWFADGIDHRDNDKPAIVDSYGDRHWCKNGKSYRLIFNEGGHYFRYNGMWNLEPNEV